MTYDVSGIISDRLAQTRSAISARAAEITSATGISFSAMLQKSVNSVQAVEEAGEADLAATPEAAALTEGLADVSSIAAQYGKQYNVSPELIMALIWAESGGRSDAVSQAGAMGLMQLMPYTAEGLGVSDPFDPAQNVDGGTRLLSSLLERYDGNVKLALAAYNMGAAGLNRVGLTSLDSSYELSLLPSETQSLLSRVEQYLEQYGYSAL